VRAGQSYVGNADGDFGILITEFTPKVAMFITAGEQGVPYTGSLPLTIAATDLTLQTTTTTINTTAGDAVVTTSGEATVNTHIHMTAAGKLGIGALPATARLRVQAVVGDASIAVFANSAGATYLNMVPGFFNLTPTDVGTDIGGGLITSINLAPADGNIVMTAPANRQIRLRGSNGVTNLQLTAANRLIAEVPKVAQATPGQIWADTSTTPWTLRIVAF